MSSQGRLVSVPGSVLITWLWRVKDRGEWSEKVMTSSHITCISLRSLVARSAAAGSGLPLPRPPAEHLAGVNSQSVTSTWSCGGLRAWGCLSPRPALTPPRLLNLPLRWMFSQARCWSHFGSGFSPQYPEFTPPGLSLCWCAILQRCYLSVRALIYLCICVCLGGWKEFR